MAFDLYVNATIKPRQFCFLFVMYIKRLHSFVLSNVFEEGKSKVVYMPNSAAVREFANVDIFFQSIAE